MATRCKRRSRILNLPITAGGHVDVPLSEQTIEYLVRVVDAGGAPLAFTLAYVAEPQTLFHFQVGESAADDRIGPIATELALRIASAAAAVAELVIWET